MQLTNKVLLEGLGCAEGLSCLACGIQPKLHSRQLYQLQEQVKWTYQ